ncbi:MAG: Endonuclease III [uncultured Thermomicrobiales bacterium]|uniref:Endonuclease III n=1 Tax=uncultured Thermomicrobiales bacterium TaxID=1645740 RepID=A0A6J4UVN8_9BACT|nr:MAG: Endonuclease III [uncultured Thermomicrobiales bacterium]
MAEPTRAPSVDKAGRKIDAVAATLDAAYGPRRWHAHGDPLDELVATVLSQHTSDTNTARAFASLKAAFPDYEAVRAAPTAAVAAAIRTGGLAQVKAPRIQRILDAIAAEHGALSLALLRGMGLDAARAWLLGLPGVGPKTAACVLLFALGLPALPVDTHVHRVARRLGAIGPQVSAERAHAVLEADLGDDRDRVYAFHLNAIAHGRAVCTARRPSCDRCPLTGCCDYYAVIAT